MFRRLWLRLMGFGEGKCPRCGRHFFYRDGKGYIWDDQNSGKITCCPGETSAAKDDK